MTNSSCSQRFYLCSKSSQGSFDVCMFDDNELAKKLKEAIGIDEEIKSISIYSTPLSLYQITQEYLCHYFVLFGTESWWWTIEKNEEGITLSRSKEKDLVFSYFYRKRRLSDIELQISDVGRKTVFDMIDWIYLQDQLKEQNHSCNMIATFDRSSVQFATELFNELAKSQLYNSSHLISAIITSAFKAPYCFLKKLFM